LPQAATLSVEVFDLLGQRTRKLVPPSRYSSGTHRIEWDGRDEAGHAVASGVYLLRVQVDDRVLSRKLTLLR